DPLLPFGLLPLHCINGKARVINLKKPSYWIELTSSQKSIVRYTLMAELFPNGILKGQLITQSLGYAAHRKRRELAEYTTVEEYIEHRNEQLIGFDMLAGEIDGREDVDVPLTERYEVEMKLYDSLAS